MAQGAGGASTSGGAAATAGTSAAGSSVGGVAAGGRSGGGAGGPRNCDGDFGAPTVVVPPVAGVKLASPMLTPDELELIYTRFSGTDVAFVHATRASTSEPFGPAAPLPDLDAACTSGQTRNGGLSPDGLRAYVACYDPNINPPLAALRIADRASLSAPFVVRPASGVMIGPSPAVSHDELTLYTSTNLTTGRGALRRFTRASTSADFGSASDVPGLSAVSLSTPGVSPDDLALYGQLLSDVAVVKRPDSSSDFGAPSVIFKSPAPAVVLGAPELTQDCRSLYFVQQDDTNAAAATGSILVAKR